MFFCTTAIGQEGVSDMITFIFGAMAKDIDQRAFFQNVPERRSLKNGLRQNITLFSNTGTHKTTLSDLIAGTMNESEIDTCAAVAQIGFLRSSGIYPPIDPGANGRRL